jgi:glycine/D-amino acid oxidase-like deaminating enzyme
VTRVSVGGVHPSRGRTPPPIEDRERAPAGNYWSTTADAHVEPTLRGSTDADVVIIGGGFTGLWTAIRLTESEPALRVTLLEQETVGYGASGRNGGFCEASLTHGLANGLRHFPHEVAILEHEGRQNLQGIVAFVRENLIDCDLEETGTLRVADSEHQVAELEAWVEIANRHGSPVRFLDQAQVQAENHSPLWKAGLLAPPSENVMINPLKLCLGLKKIALARGVVIREHSGVERLDRISGGVVARTRSASVRADHAVIATSAYSRWRRSLRHVFVPVYDYALVSDPLNAQQKAAIGWAHRQGMSDVNNRFHYFRLTADDRILWGGFDAIYYRPNRVGPELDARPETFARLERHFRQAFPQLAELRFPYGWGGAIDTTTRFTVTFGTSMGGRTIHALGYTGLGVGASRWAGGVVRDFILDPTSELLRLRFVRSSPLPFPPEPIRSIGVAVMQRELARADRHAGRRGLLLRALDRFGIGFDS